ncbi:unnamed protein product [Psylliodes chrysocephalus]|uniref:Uncharacterized protein n=1 Tax=Psylliodes chrysocephalus TaxID=3402493 RepID=A0A9P0DEW0_9CUCU|nr:unnamed protein product [Psylliodes chrysocephala]
MTLNHSKTWPVTTMAVVQLRVSPQGGAYEIIENNAPFEGGKTPKGRDEANFGDNTIAGDCNNDGLVVPLLEKHLEIFTTMSSRRKTTIRTDTVSTILDPAEFDSETNENCDTQTLNTKTTAEAFTQTAPRHDQNEKTIVNTVEGIGTLEEFERVERMEKKKDINTQMSVIIGNPLNTDDQTVKVTLVEPNNQEMQYGIQRMYKDKYSELLNMKGPLEVME